jgi:peptide-methionine (R)-S-oxide reductase
MDSHSDPELKERLTPLQYRVTQEAGTERPFTGEYWDLKEEGQYLCIVCGETLFDSATKYDSGSGWPSFTAPLSEEVVGTTSDTSHSMVRTEVSCSRCGAHLGHVFDDGPTPTGERFCMNSASLRFEPRGAEDAATG